MNGGLPMQSIVVQVSFHDCHEVNIYHQNIVWIWTIHGESNRGSRWTHTQKNQGHQGKSPFPRIAHDVSFLCWFITLKITFWSWIHPLTLHFKYKYILITNWFISCILCIHALYQINMNNFLLKTHFQNP